MNSTYRRKTLILSFASLILAILILFDVYEDYLEGTHWQHIVVEGLLFLISAGIFISLLSSFLEEKMDNKKLEKSLSMANSKNAELKSELKKQAFGLANAIDSQFADWNLTSAEKEVGFLLLKGFSSKEISQLRSTAEKTVNVQVQSIYNKSQLHSRTEFSAYFLEDLLPSSPN